MNRQSPADFLRRRNFLAGAMLLLLGLIGLRFFQFQIISHDQYAAYAENNSIRAVRLPAPRGMMFDRHGKYLVTNRPQYRLAVIPAEVSQSLDALGELGHYLGIEQGYIRKLVEEVDGIYERFQPVTLLDDISFTQRSYIEEHRLEFPGIFFVDRAIRHYPSRARATHVIGYLRNISDEDMDHYRNEGYYPGDLVGATGLEKYLERVLRGEDGYSYHLVDYLLRDLGEVPHKPIQRPVAGDSVILALDIDMQAMAELLMEGYRGALIAMEPHTGEILAYVSAPDYPVGPFTGAIPVSLWELWRDHPDKVLLNRPINGLYPPGSTFKLVAMAAALADRKIDPDSTIECSGTYQYGNRLFRCNISVGHGLVNLEDAIRLSCNVYFYQLIEMIGFDAWSDMALQFGFGRPTGVDLPQESVGLVPTRRYMNRKYSPTGWAGGHVLNLVLGQGDLLATPMQIARMTAAIANKGKLVAPTLVISPRSSEAEEPVIDLPPWIWDAMHAAMYQVVNGAGGTGFRAKIPGARVYGKTGSAENPHGIAHSWFTGFVQTPSGHQLVLTILVEQGGLGSRLASTLAAEVLTYFVENYDEVEEEELAQIH